MNDYLRFRSIAIIVAVLCASLPGEAESQFSEPPIPEKLLAWKKLELPRKTIGQPAGLVFGRRDNVVVAWTLHDDIIIWDFANDKHEIIPLGQRIPLGESIRRVIVTPDDFYAVTKTGNAVSIQSKKDEVYRLGSQKALTNDVDLAKDGQMIALARSSPKENESSVALIDIRQNTTLRTVSKTSKEIYGVTTVRFSPDQTQLAVAWENVVVRYDVKTMNELAVYPPFNNLVGEIEWEPTGKYLAVICNSIREPNWEITYGDLRVHILAGDSNKEITTLGGNSNLVTSIAFPRAMKFNSQAITAGGVDHVRRWNLETGSVVAPKPSIGDGNETYVSLSNTGKLLATVADDTERILFSIYQMPNER